MKKRLNSLAIARTGILVSMFFMLIALSVQSMADVESDVEENVTIVGCEPNQFPNYEPPKKLRNGHYSMMGNEIDIPD